MTPEHPEWRSEQDLINDERCWQPIGSPHEHTLPPPRLERSVGELRRTSHAPARLADPWELRYFNRRCEKQT